MGILSTIMDTLQPTNTNERFAVVGFFLFIFIVFCLRSGDQKGKKKPGIIQSMGIAILILALINYVIEAVF